METPVRSESPGTPARFGGVSRASRVPPRREKRECGADFETEGRTIRGGGPQLREAACGNGRLRSLPEGGRARRVPGEKPRRGVVRAGVVNKHLAFRSGLRYGRFVVELERESAAAVRDIRRMASESGVGHEGLIAQGRPWQVIVRAAEEVEADCIVMGPPGASALLETSALDRALTGGVYRRVLVHARCPVLVVR
ncbi:universal stress protein [Rubrobacter marinus]|nr:universal stress protein [Rubrobacter marinus]